MLVQTSGSLYMAIFVNFKIQEVSEVESIIVLCEWSTTNFNVAVGIKGIDHKDAWFDSDDFR